MERNRSVVFSQEIGAHSLAEFTDYSIQGYYYRVKPGLVTIPVIDSMYPGTGNVTRFLRDLPAEERVEFRCVINMRFAESLKKRGFVKTAIPVPEMDDIDTDAWVKEAQIE